MSLISELRRRNVFRVAVAYVITAWLLLQVADVVLGNIGAPDWVFKVILLVLALGLPLALLFAWAFEMTPDGIKREKHVDRSTSITQQTGRKLDRAIIAVLIVAVGYFAIDKFVLHDHTDNQAAVTANSGSRPSIAVLPFVNMSSDIEQDYFSDGISEELLNLLAKIPDFRVAGRTSSFAFKGKNEDLRTIGESLGVGKLLEGSVRKGGNRVRITAQLINVEDGFHLWSDTYDREVTDILAVQDEIAAAVVHALKVTLLDETVIHNTKTEAVNPDAYNAYLQGLFYLNKLGPANQRIAVDHFENAIAIEPEYAQAWAGLARASINYAAQGSDGVSAALQRGRDAANKALELNPDLPDAHVALSRINYAFDWDWNSAESALRRALELRPGDVGARRRLAVQVSARGNTREALNIVRSLIEADPLDENLQLFYSGALFVDGQLDAAAAVAKRLVEQNPQMNFARGYLSWVLLSEGQFDAALEVARDEPVTFFRLTALAIAHHKLGNTDEARHAQQELLEEYGNLAAFQQAQIHTFWGEYDTALDWLEIAYENRDPGMTDVKTARAFIPLRNLPRFVAIVEKMGL